MNPSIKFRLPAFILTLCLVVLCSCSDNTSTNTQVIDIESAVGTGSVYNVSEILKDIRYIRLETIPASIIGEIRNIIVENEKIYVLASNNIVTIFDINGKYLNTLSRIGRGPQEYLYILDFAVNPQGNIVIASQEAEILEYNSDLKFVRKISPGKNALSNSQKWNFIMLKDNLFASGIIYAGTNPGDIKQDLIIYNEDSLSVLQSYNVNTQQLIPGVSSVVISYYERYIYENSLNIYKIGNDTIFYIDYENGYLKTARYIMNYGKYRLSEELYFETYESGSEELRLIYINSLYETDKYLFMDFNMNALAPEPVEIKTNTRSYKRTNVYALYDKKQREFSFLNQPIPQVPGLKDDIVNGIPFWPKRVTAKQELFTWYNALELISLAEENKIDQSIVVNLKEDDNPVIVIATPK